MSRAEKKKINHLGLDFTKHVYRDAAKICIMPTKYILQLICLWPDSDKALIVFANWAFLLNMSTIECFHVYYVLLHYKDNIVSAITTFATCTTTLESIVRIYSLMFKKYIINDILYKMWKLFWPTAIANPSLEKSIKRMVFISLFLSGCFLCFSFTSSLQITGVPFVKHHDLILNSEYIFFRWNQTYIYECLYLWQYCFHWVVVFSVNGFDWLFVALVTICASQFRIIQEVFREMFNDVSKKHRKLIFGREDVSDRELLLKCWEQHNLLLDICTQLENSFNMVILIQYVTSTMSVCSGTLVLRLDPGQFTKMITYALAHVTQLFYYCFVGQELMYQSAALADSIYECNWHYHYDRDLRKAIVLMIQRSQRECVLTAAGVTNLDFSGLLKVMRITFSTYTLFDSLMTRRGL